MAHYLVPALNLLLILEIILLEILLDLRALEAELLGPIVIPTSQTFICLDSVIDSRDYFVQNFAKL